MLISLEGGKYECVLRLAFQATINEAKYKAMIACLKIYKSLNARNVKVFSGLQQVVSQLIGEFQGKT